MEGNKELMILRHSKIQNIKKNGKTSKKNLETLEKLEIFEKWTEKKSSFRVFDYAS